MAYAVWTLGSYYIVKQPARRGVWEKEEWLLKVRLWSRWGDWYIYQGTEVETPVCNLGKLARVGRRSGTTTIPNRMARFVT